MWRDWIPPPKEAIKKKNSSSRNVQVHKYSRVFSLDAQRAKPSPAGRNSPQAKIKKEVCATKTETGKSPIARKQGRFRAKHRVDNIYISYSLAEGVVRTAFFWISPAKFSSYPALKPDLWWIYLIIWSNFETSSKLVTWPRDESSVCEHPCAPSFRRGHHITSNLISFDSSCQEHSENVNFMFLRDKSDFREFFY